MNARLRRPLKLALLISALIALLAGLANAQEQPAKKEKGSANVISGRISSNDNQPLSNARVTVSKVTINATTGQTLKIDSNGDFESLPLEPGLYFLTVTVPGFIRDPSAPTPSPYVRPGDKVDVKMIRGGIITGTVRNTNGEGAVAISVKAYRVKSPNGDPIPVAFASGCRRTPQPVLS